MDNPLFKIIADNPALLEALRKLFDSYFTLAEISADLADLPNEVLAERVRARLDGRELLAEAFKEISRYKSVPDQPEKINEAR